MNKLLVLLSLFFWLVPAFGQQENRLPEADIPPAIILDAKQINFADIFGNVTGTFVLYDDAEGITLVHNARRAKERFSPWSTFEIPAILMLLDARTISSVDETVIWDKEAYPAHPALPAELKEGWESDHCLRSAYHGYAVWLFLSQMKRMSPEEIRKYLDRFSYGQLDGEPSDGFWLGKELRISAVEQVAFLRGMVDRLHGLKIDVIHQVLPVLVVEKGKDYQLVLKTGSGAANDQAFGWAVGYVERGGHRYYFAMNVEGHDYRLLTEQRHDIVRRVLDSFALLSDSSSGVVPVKEAEAAIESKNQ